MPRLANQIPSPPNGCLILRSTCFVVAISGHSLSNPQTSEASAPLTSSTPLTRNMTIPHQFTRHHRSYATLHISDTGDRCNSRYFTSIPTPPLQCLPKARSIQEKEARPSPLPTGFSLPDRGSKWCMGTKTTRPFHRSGNLRRLRPPLRLRTRIWSESTAAA